MRKTIIALVGVFTFIALGLICLMVVAVNRGGVWLTDGFYNLELVNEQTVPLDGVDKISIDYSADDVVFFTSDTNELVLKEYMSFTPDEDEVTRITQSGSRLRLEGRIRNDWFVHPNRGSRMEIYLPVDYQGSIDTSTSSGDITSSLVLKLTDLRMSASSGDIEMNEVTAAQIAFSTSSGNITIESSIGLLEAEASSGDIHIRASSGEKSLSTTSGNIVIEDSDGYTKASASSGTIKADNLAGTGHFKTTSGDIRLNFADAPEAITKDLIINTSSGTAELSIPSSLEFNFSADTSSGSINTSFDDRLNFSKDEDHAKGSVGAAPNINIKISTTSGDIEVDQQ